MNPINRVLSLLGLQIISTQNGLFKYQPIPRSLRSIYETQCELCEKNRRGFVVFRQPHYEVGQHPTDHRDIECAFAARQLARSKPDTILDIGSYRFFIAGLLAGYKVTTIDVRERLASCQNETVIKCDAKKLSLPNESFDAVVSLCSIEHFGLGRYGDEFDLNADIQAMREMQRVLRRGGELIFSTNITRGEAAIAFNAHRIYTHGMICELCEDLVSIDEIAYSMARGKIISINDVTQEGGGFDIYLGAWRKT